MDEEIVAGGGLLHRRGVLLGGALSAVGLAVGAKADGPRSPGSMLQPGGPLSAYGTPAAANNHIQRIITGTQGFPQVGSSRTPLHLLEGTITPSGLHFERHHNGVPTIDPTQHKLLVHGLVKQPLIFRYEDLLRYPMESHILFIECSGNSGVLNADVPAQISGGQLNGLLSCSEWTGVKLSLLLGEAGLKSSAQWIQAEGADAAAMTRSIPLKIAQDDAIIALFQNGEPIRPEQGFPMRLLLPGIEGNASIKWLRRLMVMEAPALSREETSKYTDLLADGRAEAFSLRMGVKSIILKPSFGLDLLGPGFTEISGLAWSGHGRVRRVEVSADGGKSWAEAALTDPALPKSITRFRIPWRWDGSPAILMSRAVDVTASTQPTRAQWMAKYGRGQGYHNNSIQSWRIDPAGHVAHVYS